jgi:hypothetical protein
MRHWNYGAMAPMIRQRESISNFEAKERSSCILTKKVRRKRRMLW